MAGICTKYGNNITTGVAEYVVDTASEVKDLPTTTSGGKGNFTAYTNPAVIGSTCICGNGGSSTTVYMLFTTGWQLM